MGFNQYVPVPLEVRKKLPFLGQAYNYVFRNSAGDVLRGVLFEITRENFYKAYGRLTGDTGTIVKGDKVFVLPNSKIPGFRLREYYKSVGAVQTEDITKATKIIGHNRSKEHVNSQALNASILIGMDNIWYDHNWRPSDRMDRVHDKEGLMNEVRSNVTSICQEDLEVYKTIYSKKAFRYSKNRWSNIDHNDFKSSPESKRFITPTGVMILYYHMAGKIPIINEDRIAEVMEKPVVIGKEEYENLRTLLGSKDESNVKVGVFLVANCDPVKSFFYVQKLAKEFKYKLTGYSEYKNVRLFMELSSWETISSMKPEEIIEHMYNTGILVQEHFDILAGEAQQLYIQADRFQSKVFKIVIEPNSKYSEYGTEYHRFEFTKEDPETEEVEIVEEEAEEED